MAVQNLFPAHAGMTRRSPPRGLLPLTVPRTRRDDPTKVAERYGPKHCSPHTQSATRRLTSRTGRHADERSSGLLISGSVAARGRVFRVLAREASSGVVRFGDGGRALCLARMQRHPAACGNQPSRTRRRTTRLCHAPTLPEHSEPPQPHGAASLFAVCWHVGLLSALSVAD